MTEALRILRPNHELPIPVLNSLDEVIASYRIGSNFGRDLPTLPSPWKAISLGGDMKLIATAELLGLSIKRYYKEAYTEIIGNCFEAI